MRPEQYKDFFNQPAGSFECGFRCVWLILFAKEKLTCPLREFINTFSWLSPAKTGMYSIDIYRMLSYLNIPHRVSIPDEKGTYIVLYSAPSGGHAVLYIKGVLYDPSEPCPRDLKLSTLKERISSQQNPTISMCIMTIELM